MLAQEMQLYCCWCISNEVCRTCRTCRTCNTCISCNICVCCITMSHDIHNEMMIGRSKQRREKQDFKRGRATASQEEHGLALAHTTACVYLSILLSPSDNVRWSR